VGGPVFDRALFRGTAAAVSFVLPFKFKSDSEKLEVYVDGVKQFQNWRGRADVKMLPTTTTFSNVAPGGADTGLTPLARSFNIAVDGAAPTNVSITTVGPVTFSALQSLIQARLDALSVQATVEYQNGTYTFYSRNPNSSTISTSQIVITTGGTDLFAAITGPVVPSTWNITTANIAGAYFEIAGDLATTFIVGAPFKVSGSTGNNGTYTIKALAYNWSTLNTRIYVTTAVASAVADGSIGMTQFYASTTNFTLPSPLTFAAGMLKYKAGYEAFTGTINSSSATFRYFALGASDVTNKLQVGVRVVVTGTASNNGTYTIRGFDYNITVATRTVVFVEQVVVTDGAGGSMAINNDIRALFDTNVITFNTAPAANAVVEVKQMR
jgi:hypothetical protein